MYAKKNSYLKNINVEIEQRYFISLAFLALDKHFLIKRMKTTKINIQVNIHNTNMI